jgi:hypothetical protein
MLGRNMANKIDFNNTCPPINSGTKNLFKPNAEKKQIMRILCVILKTKEGTQSARYYE